MRKKLDTGNPDYPVEINLLVYPLEDAKSDAMRNYLRGFKEVRQVMDLFYWNMHELNMLQWVYESLYYSLKEQLVDNPFSGEILKKVFLEGFNAFFREAPVTPGTVCAKGYLNTREVGVNIPGMWEKSTEIYEDTCILDISGSGENDGCSYFIHGHSLYNDYHKYSYERYLGEEDEQSYDAIDPSSIEMDLYMCGLFNDDCGVDFYFNGRLMLVEFKESAEIFAFDTTGRYIGEVTPTGEYAYRVDRKQLPVIDNSRIHMTSLSTLIWQFRQGLGLDSSDQDVTNLITLIDFYKCNTISRYLRLEWSTDILQYLVPTYARNLSTLPLVSEIVCNIAVGIDSGSKEYSFLLVYDSVAKALPKVSAEDLENMEHSSVLGDVTCNGKRYKRVSDWFCIEGVNPEKYPNKHKVVRNFIVCIAETPKHETLIVTAEGLRVQNSTVSVKCAESTFQTLYVLR